MISIDVKQRIEKRERERKKKKRSYICYYIICMTIPLTKTSTQVKFLIRHIEAP